MSIAQRIATLANAACMSPHRLLTKDTYLLGRMGIELEAIDDGIRADAVRLFRLLRPRLDPDRVAIRQACGEQQDNEDGVPSPVPTNGTDRVKRKVTRASVFGYSITSVLRWMGANGWKFEDAAVVCASSGAAGLADVTIRLQLKAGKDGLRGPAAPITTSQAKQLRKLAN